MHDYKHASYITNHLVMLMAQLIFITLSFYSLVFSGLTEKVSSDHSALKSTKTRQQFVLYHELFRQSQRFIGVNFIRAARRECKILKMVKRFVFLYISLHIFILSFFIFVFLSLFLCLFNFLAERTVVDSVTRQFHRSSERLVTVHACKRFVRCMFLFVMQIYVTFKFKCSSAVDTNERLGEVRRCRNVAELCAAIYFAPETQLYWYLHCQNFRTMA